MIVAIWRRIGLIFAHRPAAVLFTIVGILCAAVVVLGISTYQHDKEIEKIETKFCVENIDRCSKLLDELLDNATPAQRAKIRQIVENHN